MSNPLSILIDSAQSRLKTDAMSVLVSGRDWSPTNWQDVWVDPITNTCMLRPACFYADWSNSYAGIYTKYGIGDFTLSPSSGWGTHQPDGGGPFLQYLGASGNTSGLQGIGGAVLPANQPMAVEWFSQPTTNSPYAVFECGWSYSGDGSAGVSLRFYADGRAEVWKANAMVGIYSIGGNQPDYFSPHHAVATQFGGGATPQAPKNGYILTVLIPCRDRELLVVSSMGGGFSHIFEDLGEATAGLTITDSAPFWFYVPSPAQANLRIAPLQYASTGTICGVPSTWRNAPPLNTTEDPTNGIDAQIRIYRALTATGSVTGAVMNPGNPPTTNTPPDLPVQIELSLSGGPTQTPFVYGARAYYPSETAATTSGEGAPVDVVPYAVGCRLDVSDTVGGARLSVTLNRPGAIEAAGVPACTSQCHRPMQVFDEYGMLLDGICEPPVWVDGFGFNADGIDRNQEVELDVRDRWKLAEEYVFSDPIPLDGMTLTDAYALLAETIGIPASAVYVSPAAAGFTLCNAGSASGGDWNVMVQVGDKGSEWLDRLHQTYASTWFHGFRPNPASPSDPPVLSLIDPFDSTPGYALPSTATVTLYRSSAEALASGFPGITSSNAYRFVYRTYKVQVLEPESNDIWVTGCDPRSQKPIVVHLQTAAMKADADPTVAPASRSVNWLGYLRKYSWVDPTLTTVDACAYVATVLAGRLPFARQVVEFECEYQPGLWRGDLIALDRGSEGSPVTVRVKTFSGSFEHVGAFGSSSSPDAVWRPCRYVGESTPIVAPLDVHGTTARSIGLNWNTLKALSKQRVFDHGAQIARRPIVRLTTLS
ncbi:MAG: hypothetical protein P4L46_17485 [Fimbriimonas sp.]|nr:hypothetical protein [Fimbriimonas sp.]